MAKTTTACEPSTRFCLSRRRRPLKNGRLLLALTILMDEVVNQRLTLVVGHSVPAKPPLGGSAAQLFGGQLDKPACYRPSRT